jgi:hypothetical protein
MKNKRRNKSTSQNTDLEFQKLEDRNLLALGAFDIPEAILPGTFDGVVSVGGFCTGTLLSTGRHVLTAGHCVTDGAGNIDKSNFSIRFDVPGNSISIPVSHSEANPSIFIHSRWDGDINDGTNFDLAIIELPVVAPWGNGDNSIGHTLFEGTDVGSTFTIVGYGQTGTGTTGKNTGRSELQRLDITDGTAGNVELEFNGQTQTLGAAPTASQIESAIESFNGVNDVSVSVVAAGGGNPHVGKFEINFQDVSTSIFSQGNVPQLNASGINGFNGTVNSVDTLVDGGDRFKTSGTNTFDSLSGSNALIADFDRLPGEANLGQGDSGGPAFIGNAVAGVASFNNSNAVFGSNSGWAQVSTEIDGFIDPILNTTPYDLVFDMNYQVQGNNSDADQISISQRGLFLDIHVDGVLHYTDEITNLSSVTINGHFDDETFFVEAGLGINVEIDGGFGVNTIVGDNTINDWTLRREAGELVPTFFGNLTSFDNISSVVGGSSADTFNLTPGTLSLDVDGGGDFDRIVSTAVANDVVILGDRMGRINFPSIDFESIEAVDTGNFDDLFRVINLSSNMTINAGGGLDIVDTANGSVLPWIVTAANQAEVSGANLFFLQIETIRGDSGSDTFTILPTASGVTLDGEGGGDTVVGPNANTTWDITSAGEGQIAAQSIDFERMEVVDAGSGDDRFNLSSGTLDMAINGGSGENTVVGADVNIIWDLNATNAGQVAAQNLVFTEIANVLGGNASDTFLIGLSYSGKLIDGNDGNDEIVASDLSNVYRLDRSQGGNSQVGGYQFRAMEKISAGAGDDQLRLLNGAAQDVEFVGGDGADYVFAFDQSNSWLLRANQTGSIPAKSVSFSEIETAVGGDNADRFMLGNGDIGINVEGRGGTDVIRGPQLRRTYTITGPLAGDTGASNVGFSSLESIIAGDVADQFVFTNNTATLKRVDGRGGGDTLDFSSRGQVQVRVNGYGTTAIQEGFDGRASGLTQRFINIDKVLGSQASGGDQLKGADSESAWVVNSSALSFYRTNSESLIFEDFEKLRGGDQVDRFVVTPTTDNPMTIIGADPNMAPGDILKVNLETASNAQWRYFGPGAGRFTFSSHDAISYFQIERLDNFDFGDAATSYRTLDADNGARHRIGTPLRFGNHLDPDADGQPSADGSLDDSTSLDDEDGVWLPPTLLAHFRASAWVRASHSSRLDAWVDFDGDGQFGADEQIATSLELNAGANRVEFRVPLDAKTGETMTRFRISSNGNLGPNGLAEDGEVEDHAVSIHRVANGTSEVHPDPYQFGNKILVMAGTNGDDNIVVNPTTNGLYQVKINGQRTGLYSNRDVDRVGAYGLQGTDTIVVTSTMANEGELYGDEGNDSVFGGAKRDFIEGGTGNDKLYGHGGQDHLFGQTGNDELFGGSENDILSGGRGADRLHADGGSDLLIGGWGADWLYGQTSSDLLIGNSFGLEDDANSLEVVRQVWNSSLLSFRQKSINLRSNTYGVRLGSEIQDDGVIDRFFGGTERDMFADVGSFDEVHDFESGEYAFS